MMIALIDLGTNSIRLDVYSVDAERESERLHREKVMVRLGEGVFQLGHLQKDAKKRTLKTLRRFRDQCNEMGVERIVGVGTSALRSAKDGKNFTKLVREDLGLDLKIISGKEEAKLILRGILSDKEIHNGTFGFIDIGGGSTEVGLCEDGILETLESLHLGCARLRQAFLLPKSSFKNIGKLRKHVRAVLNDSDEVQPLDHPIKMLGSSGTIKAVRKLLIKRGTGKKIRLNDLRDLNSEMSTMTPSELAMMPGMNERRLDLIVPGAILLEELMNYLHVSTVQHTSYALRDGLLRREINRLYGK